MVREEQGKKPTVLVGILPERQCAMPGDTAATPLPFPEQSRTTEPRGSAHLPIIPEPQASRQQSLPQPRASLLTFQIERLASLVFEALEEQPQHGLAARVLVPVAAVLVVQHHRVGAAPAGEALSVLLAAGDEGAQGQVALLQPPQHDAGDGHVDGRLDVGRLVQLLRPTVHQQQPVVAHLQLLVQPRHGFTNRHFRRERDGSERI